ncbi:hypothetical protein [Carboxylicivirga caseinilyticus]|uniref:hypothetical protein n=1 Tax=Carboxylicivirga caseinilyticus TaxID=3417572 RepID=UPI003D3315D7|nr:hypothetical protein [Marinilabiliaceae bacterium A049]
MNEFNINWEQERPNQQQSVDIWEKTILKPFDNWSNNAEILKEKIEYTHINGGIQLHKYKLTSNEHFNWFAYRNRLNKINFVERIISHKNLNNYRNDLEIEGIPEIQMIKSCTDIYDLSGLLARILGYGGAYNRIDPKEAWIVSNNFIKSEFENRFDEILQFVFSIKNARWFYKIVWDYSILLFDKRNNILTLLDITDTD